MNPSTIHTEGLEYVLALQTGSQARKTEEDTERELKSKEASGIQPKPLDNNQNQNKLAPVFADEPETGKHWNTLEYTLELLNVSKLEAVIDRTGSVINGDLFQPLRSKSIQT